MERVSKIQENAFPDKSDKLMDIILRQEMESFTPNCNVKCAIICNLILIVLFIVLGASIIASSNGIIEYSVDYTNCKVDSICDLPIEIKQTMKAPVYLFYTLTNFYLNQRDLVRSRSYAQLRGEVDKNNYTKCNGAKLIGEVFDTFNRSNIQNIWSNNLTISTLANPCGLQAKSLFQDMYFLLNVTGNSSSMVAMNETNISNDYDRKYMFKNSANYNATQWMDVTNEHFIVWMQMESFPNFGKLYARIDNDLMPGIYNFTILSINDVASFGGTKGLLLTTSSALGRASFFGFVLIIAAFICFAIIIIILVCYAKGTALDDIENLKWD